MIKKIQQYLLLNHPLIWNIKIIPVILYSILINLLLFILGYSTTKVSFQWSYYYNLFDFDTSIIYFGIVVLIILSLILWLIAYSKNNAFKSFYPTRTSKLYTEWLLIFVIVFSIVLFPHSYERGSNYKIKTYASQSEAIKALETLNMVKILIPSNIGSYFQEYPTEINQRQHDRSPKGPNSLIAIDYSQVDLGSQVDIDSIINNQENIDYTDFPNFTQFSLLNYNQSYPDIYLPAELGAIHLRDFNTTKKWLIEENSDSIKKLMDSFLTLQEMNGLLTSLTRDQLTRDQWFNLIYNPTKYPVGYFNLISLNSNIGNTYQNNGTNYKYYVEYNSLEAGYNKIIRAHIDRSSILLYLLCISVAISTLILSFRVTSGKTWLIAFVSMGLILFISGIFVMMIKTLTFYCIILLFLFIVEINIIYNKRHKAKTDVLINHLIWLLPLIPLLLLFIIKSTESVPDYDLDQIKRNTVYIFINDNLEYFFWINIPLTCITMWFFMKLILMKWKGIPEE